MPPIDPHADLAVQTRICVAAASERERARRRTDQLNSPRLAARFMRYLAAYDQETIAVVSLDAKSKPLSVFRAGTGGTRDVRAGLQHVLKVPILAGATKVLIFHNHPSGDPRPSLADVSFYHRVAAAFDLVGPRLVDSIVVAADGYWSLARGVGTSWRVKPKALAETYAIPQAAPPIDEASLNPSERALVRAIRVFISSRRIVRPRGAK